VQGVFDPDALLEEEFVRSPLRRHDLPPVTDGAVAVVIARKDRANQLCERPVWITGFAHCAELHYPGMRDLRASPSTTAAAQWAGLGDGPIEVAELQAAFTHEEPLLKAALGLGDDVPVNPSGGPLAANPIMATGLVRIAEAARQVRDNGRHRALAHATSGPCLQQNLVCIVEGSK
jgi:acetyl-CoA acetyltransferase